MCLVIEIVDRRTFVKDQIIEAQQDELRASRETIRRYVPRAVSEHIVSGDTVVIDVPTRRRVTVLIADLVGVTEPMRMRIGISTGVLSVGSFGSVGRMTCTAIGLHTNIAARLEAHCEPGEVLVNDSTWWLLHDRIPCEPRSEVQCKGVRDPVRVYSPAG
ncbi:MAG: adenylate/guanylate cyclase domain-containing protein [Frankiales bacterium]|nr:MAG: adenylate/guanylate cyclase domain-containing protein [Frankiales bacterium]